MNVPKLHAEAMFMFPFRNKKLEICFIVCFYRDFVKHSECFFKMLFLAKSLMMQEHNMQLRTMSKFHCVLLQPHRKSVVAFFFFSKSVRLI